MADYLAFSFTIGSSLLIIIGFIMILIKAFARSVWWGIGCILLPPLILVLVIMNWEDTRKGFVVFLIGAILLGGTVILAEQEIDEAITDIKIKKITVTTGLDNTNLPINDLSQVSLNMKKVFLHVKMEVPPGINYVFTGRIYDANNRLFFDYNYRTIPSESVWNVWFYHTFDKSKDTPGFWRFEFWAGDTKLAEKSFNVNVFIPPIFTADIDGQVFEDDRGGSASYTSGKVKIGAKHIAPDTTNLIIILNATEVGTYLLNDDNKETGNWGAYYIGNKIFASTSRFTGSVTITRLDLEKKNISGTFEFQAVQVVPPGSKVINITNGVFKDFPIANW